MFARDRDPDTGRLTCWRCSIWLTEHDPTLASHATLGHRLDRIAGGTDALDNLAPECAGCNYRAGASTVYRRHSIRNTSRPW